jgi:hypothetical protein
LLERERLADRWRWAPIFCEAERSCVWQAEPVRFTVDSPPRQPHRSLMAETKPMFGNVWRQPAVAPRKPWVACVMTSLLAAG